MSFFEKHKIKIIFAAIVVVSLALTFWLEGRTPEKHTEDTQVTSTVKPKKLPNRLLNRRRRQRRKILLRPRKQRTAQNILQSNPTLGRR